MSLFRNLMFLHQGRHQLLAVAKAEFRERKNWLKILINTPSNTKISWTTQFSGKNITIGRQCQIEGYTKICLAPNTSEYITIGDHTRVSCGAQIYSWGGFVEIGEHCSINANTILYGTGGLKIGKCVRIAANTIIVASTHKFDRVDLPIMRQGITAKGIRIENNVWIGAGVCILDGVVIGEGSIVAAGAVINRDVAPYTIVAGIPARSIRHRLCDNNTVSNIDKLEIMAVAQKPLTFKE